MRLVLQDMAGTPGRPSRTIAPICAAPSTGCAARRTCARNKPDAGGVSAGWSFEDGWLPSYPETTGYIVETFIAAAEYLGRPELIERATGNDRLGAVHADADGAFPGHFGEAGSQPVIFNQGQIMHGLVAGYTQLDRQDCLEAGVRAGHWLAAQQDDDGCYRKFEHNGVPHVYNTRATWALVGHGIGGERSRACRSSAAKPRLGACPADPQSAGSPTNAFLPGRHPYTHTIAYAIRGFLEVAVLLGEERYLGAAEHAARGVDGETARRWLAGRNL